MLLLPTIVAAALSPGVPGARRGAVHSAVSRLAMQQQTSSPKGVVITGGAGGVGYAYADEFLARGHWVVICDVKDPADAVAALRAKHASVPNAKIEGCVCDVSDASSVEGSARSPRRSSARSTTGSTTRRSTVAGNRSLK